MPGIPSAARSRVESSRSRSTPWRGPGERPRPRDRSWRTTAADPQQLGQRRATASLWWRLLGAAEPVPGVARSGRHLEPVAAAKPVRLADPVAAPQDAADAGRGSLRVPRGALGVVIRGVPVGAPFPGATRHLQNAIRALALREAAERLWTVWPAADGVAPGRIPGVTPGILPAIGAPGRLLPFRFGRQPSPRPFAVGLGLIPRDVGGGVVIRRAPDRRRGQSTPTGLGELPQLAPGDLGLVDQELGEVHAVLGPLVGLAHGFRASHREF